MVEEKNTEANDIAKANKISENKFNLMKVQNINFILNNNSIIF